MENEELIEVQFTPWSRRYFFSSAGIDLRAGDYVVVDTDLGLELGQVKGFKKADNIKKDSCADAEEEKCGGDSCPAREIKPIIRKATSGDFERAQKNEASKEEALNVCRDFIKKHNLPMKLVDAHFSFDGSRITFAFIADGRIDFRELVKDLTRRFQKSIRIHQIGVRDESKIFGDIGPCGRKLCCQGVLKENYGGVTTEMAYVQQIAHRGLERLSGCCGRLKCCLNYELPVYEELKKDFPPLGGEVKVKNSKGRVVSWELLKQTVKVDLGDDTLIEVPLKEIKK